MNNMNKKMNLCCLCGADRGNTKIAKCKKCGKIAEEEKMQECPLCRKSMTIMTPKRWHKKRRHNFCPAIINGQIVNLCMDCKMRQSVGGAQGW